MSCSQPYLNTSYFNNLRADQFDFIPIWAGYQDPCLQGTYNTFSTAIATDYSQGVQSAKNAIATDQALTINPTGYVALDLEAYAQGPYVNEYGLSNCELMARYYVSGWDYELGQLVTIHVSAKGAETSLG